LGDSASAKGTIPRINPRTMYGWKIAVSYTSNVIKLYIMLSVKEIKATTNILKYILAFLTLIKTKTVNIKGKTNPNHENVIPLMFIPGMKYNMSVPMSKPISTPFFIASFLYTLSPTLNVVKIIRTPSEIMAKVILSPFVNIMCIKHKNINLYTNLNKKHIQFLKRGIFLIEIFFAVCYIYIVGE